jgi:hypothetical protein
MNTDLANTEAAGTRARRNTARITSRGEIGSKARASIRTGASAGVSHQRRTQ